MKVNDNWRDSTHHIISSATGFQSSQLKALFEDQLREIYGAEKELLKAFPKMLKNATSDELIEILEDQLALTPEHIIRIGQVFKVLGKRALAEKCKAMEEIIIEGKEIMEDCGKGGTCDAGIISVCKKIKHYEIASYGILYQFAGTLRLMDVANLLQQTLNEEKDTDDRLSKIVVNAENIKAEIAEREAEF